MGNALITRRRSRKAVLLNEVESLLSTQYPTLYVVQTEPKLLLRGRFPVRLEGQTLDYFLVEVEFQRDHPKSVPIVREIGCRIPRHPDRHVYEDGECCLFLSDERWRCWGDGKGVADMLAGVVNDFLLGQLYFERHRRFPFGERRHGAEGIYDYYAEELGTTDLNIIIRFLSYLAHRRVKGHWRCYCGSGQKMRHCHYAKLLDLRDKIDRRVARKSLSALKDAQKRHPAPMRAIR